MKATGPTLDVLLGTMKLRIRSIPLDVIRPRLQEAARRLADAQDLDAPCAAALAIDVTIWTHDRPPAKKAGLPVLRSRDLLDHL